MTCAACNNEPKIGSITVPMQGRNIRQTVDRAFPIGQRCYDIHRRASEGTATLRDYADLCLLVPSDPAAQAWLKALSAQTSLIVSPRIEWRAPPETSATPVVN